MFEDIQAAIPIGILMSFMIGPVFFVLLETSVIRGVRCALLFDLGVILADVVFIALAYFSSYQLLDQLTNLPAVFVFGGVILSVYGLIIYLKKVRLKDFRPKSLNDDYIHLIIKGFLLNFVNIGVLIFWLGLLVIIGPSLDNEPKRISTFFGTILATYFITDIFKVVLAKQLKSKLTFKRIFLLKKAIGVILFVCGLLLIVKGFLPKEQLNIEKGIEFIEQKKPVD
jgi:threonine/homoserine/homoserine lactone efflux protein